MMTHTSSELLIESNVYKALLIPITIMSVNYYYFIFESIFLFSCFIFSKQLFILLFSIPLHSIGIVLQRLDPHFMPLLKVHLFTLKSGRNHAIWGGKSYAA
ncbi:MAG: hypothetical protein HAW62_06230 [Endozoicomonadaceae bacterium]|nr:hypothetical protein [Endozoicomonadaceae bacterium]